MNLSGSRRRVFPLGIDTSAAPGPTGDNMTTTTTIARPLPPKSPLHHGPPARSVPAAPGLSRPEPPVSVGGGFDRLLLMRNLNAVTSSGVEGPRQAAQGPAGAKELSAAQNHKDRKAAEARRRLEVELMTREDYTDTPEGQERRQRQEERARMEEEELGMLQLIQAEKAQRRAEQLARQREQERQIQEAYAAKRRQEREEKEQKAREQEAARRVALEAKMKALKEAADAQAQAEFAARQRKLEQEALHEHDLRVMAVETARMLIEDALAGARRQEEELERERQRQIDTEAAAWREFEAREAERQREETQRRRAAQAQQYEQDRARRMQIHRLQKERDRLAAEKLQQQHHLQQIAPGDVNDGDLIKPMGQMALPPRSPPPPHRPKEADALQAPAPASSSSPSSSQCCDSEIPKAPEVSTVGPSISDGDAKPSSITDTAVEAEAPTEPISPDAKPTVSSTSPEAAPVLTPRSPPALENAFDLGTWYASGIEAFVQVLTVSKGSPARMAGLVRGDLIVDFAGITRTTPQCLLAIATCIETNVNQGLTVGVLRPSESTSAHPTTYRLVTAQLIPQSWRGKGLLGCQLSPFKYDPPESSATHGDGDDANSGHCQSTITTTANGQSDVQTHDDTNVDTAYETIIVIHCVRPKSLAERLGLHDGDVVVRCGDLQVVNSVAELANYLQEHWRNRLRIVDPNGQNTTMNDVEESVRMDIQRWDPDAQMYVDHQVLLPLELSSTMEDFSMGCTLTTYTEYYYGNSANLSICSECGTTQLATVAHAAALNGHIPCLEAIGVLYQAGVLEWRDEEGRTPLYFACYALQVDAVKILLGFRDSHNVCFDPDRDADYYGDSPLHATVGGIELAGTHATDTLESAHKAQQRGLTILRLLFKTGYTPDINVQNPWTRTTCAHLAPNVEVLEILGNELGADLTIPDATARLPLHYACARQDLAAVDFLCHRHPEVIDYPDNQGTTPLHVAAGLGLFDVVRILVETLTTKDELSAIYATDADGQDVITIARREGFEDLAVWLEDRGRVDGTAVQQT